MEIDGKTTEKNENGRVLWINHSLFKAFITGAVMALGWFAVFMLIIQPFGLDEIDSTEQIPYFIVFDCFLPLISIYAIMLLANKLLKPFGFEGVKFHQNEKLDFPKLFSAGLGCLVVYFLIMMIILIGGLIMVLGSEYVGETKFKLLIGAIVVGILAFFALARRVSHNQIKAEQETQ